MWTAQDIREKMASDQKWLERGVLAIYKLQSSSERQELATLLKNQIGFNTVDARTGAMMAQWLEKGNHLTGKWIELAHKIMPKYAVQLALLANRKKGRAKGDLLQEIRKG